MSVAGTQYDLVSGFSQKSVSASNVPYGSASNVDFSGDYGKGMKTIVRKKLNKSMECSEMLSRNEFVLNTAHE